MQQDESQDESQDEDEDEYAAAGAKSDGESAATRARHLAGVATEVSDAVATEVDDAVATRSI
jgi:hypothetical protein